MGSRPKRNPKSIWYGLGRFVEWLDLTFTFDSKAKFEKELRRASKRLEETKMMMEAGEFETSKDLIKDYSDNIERASRILDRLPEDEKLDQSKVLLIVISSYTSVLKDMYKKEIAQELEDAINVSLKAQQKAIETISDVEPMMASMILQFESSGLRPELEILNVSMKKQILAGEETKINFNVLNNGNAESEFRIILYEDGNPIKSMERQKICPGCTSNYTLTWTAREGVNEISIGLEEPEDANQENNYITLSIEVISPKCYSDQECSDANPCTKDICLAKGTMEARCEHIQITECINGDGCCPAGCNALNDSDCKPSCGNGICEPGENKCNCPEDCGVCSGPCKDEPCWEWECVNGECQCELQANCCGNRICEENEYYFNCTTGEVSIICPGDCCDPFVSHQPDEPCECPPGTEKIIINPETGEFICECIQS